MNFFNKLFRNNEDRAPDEKDGVLSASAKLTWKKLPLKMKLIVISIAGGIFGIVLLVTLLVALFQLESVNSTEVAGSTRYDENTTNSYEQKVIEYQDTNNITQYIDVGDKNLNRHEAYYDSLFRGYEQYKSTDKGRWSFIESIKNFFTGIFKPRSKVVAPAKVNNGGYVDDGSGFDFNLPYGVQIDTSLITTTLYSSRFYGDMIFKAEMQEIKESDEYIDFFLDSGGTQYYDLHSKAFRDEVEVDYFSKAREDEDISGEREVTKLAIAGIEILSKYMIQRVETYYTLNKDFVNVDYDTTRHIKIVHKFNMSEECFEYVKVDSSPTLDHKRSTGGKYSWNDSLAVSKEEKETLKSCKSNYTLSRYDNAKYDNQDKSINGFFSQYTTGFDELSYELDCAGYKEYLLGNYPTASDKEMFCEGNCYSDNFIAAYYHNYVPNNEKRAKKIEDVVNDIYSVLDYYENATMNYNVCSDNYNDSYIYDLSCGIGPYMGGNCSFNNVTIELLDFDGKVSKRLSMKDYIMGVARAERDTTNLEYLRAMMITAKSYLLARGRYKEGSNVIQIRWSNKDQVYASLDETTYRYEIGNYSYYNTVGEKGNVWKRPLSEADRAIYSEAYDSIANYVLIRKELATIPVNWGYSDETEHVNKTQDSWEDLIDQGLSFSEALAKIYPNFKLVECDLSADNSYQMGSGLSGPIITESSDRCTGYVDNSTFNSVLAANIIKHSLPLIGKPYVRGDEFENGQVGGDCSGLTTYVYNKAGINLARMTADSQYKKYRSVCVQQMMTGDILFWADGGGSKITHTGIYLGGITYGGRTYKNAIVDASSKNGEVVIRELWGTNEGSSYPLVAVARPYAK